MNRFAVLTATLASAVVLSACSGGGGGGGGDAAPGPTPAAPTTGYANEPVSSPSPARTTTGTSPAKSPSAPPTARWSSAPVVVKRDVAVPPTPVLLRIRSARHPESGYERVVFDFQGPLPGYTVRYVNEVREDGSGRPVTMPGRRYLLVVFSPADAHTQAGTPTVAAGVRRLDYSMLRGYAQVGDFEGYVSIALGLDDVVGFRIGELPGRIYLDVAA